MTTLYTKTLKKFTPFTLKQDCENEARQKRKMVQSFLSLGNVGSYRCAMETAKVIIHFKISRVSKIGLLITFLKKDNVELLENCAFMMKKAPNRIR